MKREAAGGARDGPQRKTLRRLVKKHPCPPAFPPSAAAEEELDSTPPPAKRRTTRTPTASASTSASAADVGSSSAAVAAAVGMCGPSLPLRVPTASHPVKMPQLGLGTYKFKGSGAAQRAVVEALRNGYRLIDTAFVYGGEKTEREVGAGLRQAWKGGVPGLAREDVFVVTKHWRAYHGYEATLQCLDLSLSRLDLEHIDLWLMHWPGPAYHTMARKKEVIENSPQGAFVYARVGHERDNLPQLRAETWRAMEDAFKAGKCRAIGVSNFTVEHLERLRQTATVWPPAVNQVELHPYLPQTELRQYCDKHGIVLQAYASLGGQDASSGKLRDIGGPLLEHDVVTALAESHGVTPAQVLLRWAVQRGLAVIPKSKTPSRIASNAAIFESVPDPSRLHQKGRRPYVACCSCLLVLLLLLLLLLLTVAPPAAAVSWELSEADMSALDGLEQESKEAARLCWARDPLRNLDFD